MPPSVFNADRLAAAALSRLRQAVELGALGFMGVHIPAVRHQEVPEGTLMALFCYAAEEQGQGVSRQIPRLKITDTIHIDGFVAQGREAATDLDVAVGILVQSVLDLLLQDTTFLELFGWLDGCNVEKQDVLTGREAHAWDIVEFRIVLTLGGGHTVYEVAPPADAMPLQVAAVQMTIGDIMIEEDLALPQ